MSMFAECDRCGKTSPFVGEDYAGGRYVYTLPAGWGRDEDGDHVCRDCGGAELRDEIEARS